MKDHSRVKSTDREILFFFPEFTTKISKTIQLFFCIPVSPHNRFKILRNTNRTWKWSVLLSHNEFSSASKRRIWVVVVAVVVALVTTTSFWKVPRCNNKLSLVPVLFSLQGRLHLLVFSHCRLMSPFRMWSHVTITVVSCGCTQAGEIRSRRLKYTYIVRSLSFSVCMSLCYGFIKPGVNWAVKFHLDVLPSHKIHLKLKAIKGTWEKKNLK